ncbi:hypothetical protein FK529_14805 [Tsukamurella asaccharolytica]|uniref:Uncharacterized protein n=1 Tax=Tsukamurella asaccharolytica TaxID=2592067 RepID=A0A5C5R7I3_9ACTN|nr:hypothetical protein [Tsukamurella asaccharolytica]TWS18582.1 hypothetical protein FK529_14805 [Tsukamurella asaccharolytica]
MTRKLVAATAVFALGAALAPTAAANAAPSYCGTSTRGAAVYSGNANTSCAFAINTANTYHVNGSGSRPFKVYSRVTNTTYIMTCTNAGSVCTGGNGAVVYLR